MVRLQLRDGRVRAAQGHSAVLRVDAVGMHRAGHEFFVAANGVWLTATVPPQWIGEPGTLVVGRRNGVVPID